MKKYILTENTIEFEGRTLRQIQYIRSFRTLTRGYMGGWIEHEGNLSHDGNCCVVGHAMVFGDARVQDDVIVGNNAIIKDNAKLLESTKVGEFCVIGADSVISGNSVIHGKSNVFFYDAGLTTSEKDREINISGKSVISNSTIEATGTIKNSIIKKTTLSGSLDINNRNIE